MTKLQ